MFLRTGIRRYSSAVISGVQLFPDFARVSFGSHGTADFHYFYLRHNCDSSRHPLTNEKTLCSSKVPLDLRAVAATPVNDGRVVHFRWDRTIEGSGESLFTAEWLQRHAYARNRKVEPFHCDADRVTIPAARSPSSPPLWQECQERVVQDGIVIVKNAGGDTEKILAEFEHGGWAVTPTHFGRIEDLRADNTTNANNDQLGYTDAAVELHTDQPFIAKPPHFQLLHCIQRAASGGMNTAVDVRAVANYLAASDRPAFDVLRTTPVHFHRRQKKFSSLFVSPILECEPDGTFKGVRCSYFTMDPMTLDFPHMETFYRAYAKFAALINDPKWQYRVLLAPGDFLLYDNRRMLHARTSFTGARWLRGIYFDAVAQPQQQQQQQQTSEGSAHPADQQQQQQQQHSQ